MGPVSLPHLAMVVDADSRLTPRSAMADIRPAAILRLAERQIQGPWMWRVAVRRYA